MTFDSKTVEHKLIHVVHHEPFDGNKGGVCFIAYHYSGDSFIRVCSSVCSTRDQYSRKIGHRLALHEMHNLSGVRLPIPAYLSRHNISYRDLRDLLNVVVGFE